MKSIVALLLAAPLIWARGDGTTMMPDEDTRICYRGAARVAFRPSDDSLVAYGANGRVQDCGDSTYGCGAVRKFGISRQWDPENSRFIDDSTVAWSSLNLGCARESVCDAIIGDDEANGECRYASYNYVRYEPMSCNASAAYDAEYYRQDVKLYYGCCRDGNKCVDPSRDSAGNEESDLENTCTENTALGDYISDLQLCWQVGREVFRRYFLCKNEDIFDFRAVCVNDMDEWDRDTAASDQRGWDCYYKRTCTKEILELMEAFSICACRKAQANGFSGRAITALMESNWNRWCPGIDLSCDADNDYAPYIRRRLRKRRLRLRIKRKIADLTEDVRNAIRDKIYEYCRWSRDSEDDEDGDGTGERMDIASYRAASDDSTGRRLLEVDSENYSDLEFDLHNTEEFDDAVNDILCDATQLLAGLGDELTGGELDILGCDSEEEYEAEYGTDPDATTEEPIDDPTTTPGKSNENAGFMVFNGFAFIMAVFGYIMQ